MLKKHPSCLNFSMEYDARNIEFFDSADLVLKEV